MQHSAFASEGCQLPWLRRRRLDGESIRLYQKEKNEDVEATSVWGEGLGFLPIKNPEYVQRLFLSAPC